MADLGSLYFDILLRDKTAAQRTQLKNDIVKDLEQTIKGFTGKVGVGADKDILRNSVTTALTAKPFEIGIVVDKATARQAVQQALSQINTWNGKYTADDLRAEKGKTQQAIQQLKQAQAELAKVRQAHIEAHSAANIHASASIGLGNALNSNLRIAGELGSVMTSLYSIHMAKEFLANVVEIGGELEHQKIALNTIFGDKGKTIDLFDKVKDLARNSPFGVMELTKSVKALSAYGVEYNDIYDTAKRLADISAATSVDINRLILAFGKTKSRTFLDGLEAKQFAYANIPIYEMLSKKLTELEGKFVSVKEVMGRISKREIGFDMVKEVLWDLTDEGGKFYNMQEELAGSVKTSWKLVKDNLELMYGEMAESMSGPLKGVAEILQDLTRNWRTMGAVIGVAVGTLGVYRASQMATNLILGQATKAKYSNILAAKAQAAADLRVQGITQSLNDDEKNIIATTGKLTMADFRLALANKQLNANDIVRLGTMGKLNKEQLIYAMRMGLINKAQARAILQGRLWGMNLGRLGNGIKSVGYAIVSLGNALKALMFNPFTIMFAAISAITVLWQRNSQEAERAKEMGDNMFTKAQEAAKNLHETIKSIATDLSKLSDEELARVIEKLETGIKDYGLNPDQVIANAAYDSEGNLRTQRERAEILRQQLEYLEQAAELQEKLNTGGILSNSIIASDGGWFDDDLNTDIDDYKKYIDGWYNEIEQYIATNSEDAKKVVAIALRDEVFAEAAGGLKTWREQFVLLSSRAKEYCSAIKLVKANFENIENGKYLDSKFSNLQSRAYFIREKYPLLEELDETIKAIKSRLRIDNIGDISEPMKIALTQMGNTLFESLSSLPQEHQYEIRKFWNDAFGLDGDTPMLIGEMVSKFKEGLGTLDGETRRLIENGLPLDDVAKHKVDNFIENCAKSLKTQFPHLKDTIQTMLDNGEFRAQVLFSVNRNQGVAEWQQALIDIWGDNPEVTVKIKTATDIFSAYESLAELKKNCNDWLTKFGTLKLPIGIKWTPGTLFTTEQINSVDDPIIRQYLLNANEKMSTLNTITNGEKSQGIDLNNFAKDSDKNKKDKFLEKIKERHNLIKKAYDEYKKWLDLVGADAALVKVKESGVFDALFPGKDPSKWTNIADYKGELEKLIKQLEPKANTKERREQVVALKMLVNLDLPRDEAQRVADELKKRIENEISAINKKWDLYDKLIEAGMMKAQARTAAGLDGTFANRVAALRAELEQRFKAEGLSLADVPNDEAGIAEYLGGENSEVYKRLYKSYKEFKDAVEKDGIEISIKETNAIAKYRSTAEKIAKLNEEYAELTGLNIGSNGELEEQEGMSPGKKALFREYQEKLDELKSELLALLPEWEAIFGDHTYQSYGQIQKARGYASEMVNNATVKKDENGKPVSFTSFFTNAKGERQAISGSYKELEKLKKVLDELYKKGEDKNPFAALAENLKTLFNSDDKDDSEEKAEKIAKLGESAADSAKLIGDLVGGLQEMFEALGEEDLANTMGMLGDAMTSISNIGSAFAKGGIVGGVAAAAGEAVGWITKIVNARHAEIEMAIKMSQIEAKKTQAIYDSIERRMKAYLGNAKSMRLVEYDKDVKALDEINAKIAKIKNGGAIGLFSLAMLQKYSKEADKLKKRLTAYNEGGAYGYQRQLLQEQQDELVRQRDLKKEDKGDNREAIADYEAQIEEMSLQIRQFAEDTANTLYGIDLKGWASQIGDSLMDAWKRGEDGAEAFKNTVASIMGDVMGNLLRLAILEPMMENLRTMLFGKDGKSGLFGKDFELSQDEVKTIGTYLMEQNKKVDSYNAAMDMIEGWLKSNYGISLKETDGEKNGLSKGVQSVTESTADLLASYINAMRADVSLQREYARRIVEEVMPTFNVLVAAQLRQLEVIADNTGRNADTAEKILSLINSNINPGKGFKIS